MEATGYSPFPNLKHRNFLQGRIEVPLFTRALSLASRCRVLEVGCGRGVALPVFEALLRPASLVGLDIELELLRQARSVAHPASGVRLVQGDVRRIPFPDETFDVVVDFGTCYHIEGPHLALKEIERVLSAGGVFATESKLAQILAHPFRTFGRRLRVPAGSSLRPFRNAGMWRSFRKVAATASTG